MTYTWALALKFVHQKSYCSWLKKNISAQCLKQVKGNMSNETFSIFSWQLTCKEWPAWYWITQGLYCFSHCVSCVKFPRMITLAVNYDACLTEIVFSWVLSVNLIGTTRFTPLGVMLLWGKEQKTWWIEPMLEVALWPCVPQIIPMFHGWQIWHGNLKWGSM